MEKELKKIYYDVKHPASFGGVNKLVFHVRKKFPLARIRDVREWLSNQSTYSLFKPSRKKFERNVTYAKDVDLQWQADLMDMSLFSPANRGYRYLLVVVDVFSRYAFVVPVRNKRPETIIKGFQSIFKTGRKPKVLQTDQGKEFISRKVQTFLKTKRICFFTSLDDELKCAIVERLNRTLRSKIYRFLYFKNTHKYIDVLQNIVSGYNNSFHRSLKMAPADVSSKNKNTVIKNLYGRGKKKEKKLEMNTLVRIRRKKGAFEKGATSNWTDEVFRIIGIKEGIPRVTYTIEDLDGETIRGSFYREDLNPIGVKNNG